MVRCRKCRFSYLLKNELWCDYISDYVREDSSCEHGEFPEDYYEPQTNYDCIISKTPEELAQLIMSIEPAACPFRGDHGDDCRFTHCEKCWLDWLKEEAKEVEEVVDE